MKKIIWTIKYILSYFLDRAIMNLPDCDITLSVRKSYLIRRLGFMGDNARILNGARIWGGKLLRIGNDSVIAEENTISLGPGKSIMQIGEKCLIGPQCFFRNANHRFDSLEIPIRDQGHESRDIVVGNNVWIGARCVILGGTNIGDNTVISSGSVVSGEIPPNVIAAGIPARVISKRI
jgi:acetyltransferase-like isoleucine patch superfamily enzyme